MKILYILRNILYMTKKMIKDENGMGTVEIVMIIAAIMCITLLFRESICEFVLWLITEYK